MERRPLLIGSGNQDKAAELAAILAGLPWEVKSLRDYPECREPEEDGQDFEENALKKAACYGARFSVDCVADDSGLEVDALGGAPGLYSARYAGPGCSYADNNAKLLKELEGVPMERRTARFVCCAALVRTDASYHTEIGTVEGHIALEPRGSNGFGYDPVFVPTDHERTFGEIDPEVKHGLSHRGAAFRQMRAYLETLG